MGKPSARSMAGASTSESRLLPNCESTIAIESRTAGTVAALGPWKSMYGLPAQTSGLAAAGARPWPFTTTTFLLLAS